MNWDILVKYKRIKKIAWIQSQLLHLEWKFKLWAGFFEGDWIKSRLSFKIFPTLHMKTMLNKVHSFLKQCHFIWLNLVVLSPKLSADVSFKGVVKVPPNWGNWRSCKLCFKKVWTLELNQRIKKNLLDEICRLI